MVPPVLLAIAGLQHFEGLGDALFSAFIFGVIFCAIIGAVIGAMLLPGRTGRGAFIGCVTGAAVGALAFIAILSVSF